MPLISNLNIGTRFHALLDRLFPPPKTVWQHLRQNLIVGMFVVILLTLFQGSDFVRNNREKSIDWLMRMYRGVTVTEGKDFRPFVFYDIDEKSYESWGEPFFVPRPKLAKLIEAALLQAPAVLVVDVELVRRSGDDDELIQILRQHAMSPKRSTTIVLLKGFKWKESPDHGGYLTTRTSFLEDAVPGAKKQAWGSPLFERDPDGKIRRWKLWQQACTPSGSPVLVPSVQLLTLSNLERNSGQQALDKTIANLTPRSCTDEPSSRGIVDIGGHKFSVKADPFEQRILYSLPWKLDEGETRPEVNFNGTQTRLLSIIPAHAITEGGLHPSMPAGHIAIIGASYEDARDIHVTPLGVMPGSLILVNAMHSFIQHGQLNTPPIWLQLLTAAVLLVAVSLIFIKFPSMTGAIVSFVTVILLLVPLSMYFFRYGVWLDFALPLTAVKVFQIIMEYHRNRKNRGA